jgi:hypothetical protein
MSYRAEAGGTGHRAPSYAKAMDGKAGKGSQCINDEDILQVKTKRKSDPLFHGSEY